MSFARRFNRRTPFPFVRLDVEQVEHEGKTYIRTRCAWCKAPVLSSIEDDTINHQQPTCRGFAEWAQARGLGHTNTHSLPGADPRGQA